MVALAEIERRSSPPLPLAATASPVSVTWPGSGYGNKSYTGREWDPETQLYYYRARYYDPKIGRFISEDPIRFDSGINFYSYVDSSPSTFRDPFGNAKIKGAHNEPIYVHKYDADDIFPSHPHGHLGSPNSTTKVNVYTGEIVEGTASNYRVIGRLSSKQLAKLQLGLRRAGLIGIAFIALNMADAYAADCGEVGPNTKKAAGRTVGGLAGAWAGAESGAYIGGAIGTAIEPGGGTAIGAAIGGVVGGVVGAIYGEDAGEFYVEQ